MGPAEYQLDLVLPARRRLYRGAYSGSMAELAARQRIRTCAAARQLSFLIVLLATGPKPSQSGPVASNRFCLSETKSKRREKARTLIVGQSRKMIFETIAAAAALPSAPTGGASCSVGVSNVVRGSARHERAADSSCPRRRLSRSG